MMFCSSDVGTSLLLGRSAIQRGGRSGTLLVRPGKAGRLSIEGHKSRTQVVYTMITMLCEDRLGQSSIAGKVVAFRSDMSGRKACSFDSPTQLGYVESDPLEISKLQINSSSRLRKVALCLLFCGQELV